MSYDYAYAKRWRHERNQGITRTTEATDVALHIATCQGAGMSLRAIAAEAGTSASVLSDIVRGKRDRIKVTTADALLAVRPGVTKKASTQTTEPFVPKIGAVRRVQALLALGWTHATITETADLAAHASANVLHQQGRWVTLTTHEAVARAYKELSGKAGPSQATRTRAARLGYLPPLAWDDIDHDAEADTGTDEPEEATEYLDDVAIERALAGDRSVTLTDAERTEAIRRWFADGGTITALEQCVGWNVRRHIAQQEVAAWPQGRPTAVRLLPRDLRGCW